MYQQFGFQHRPFGSIATAASYFPASTAETALESIRICIDRAAGPALLIGGTGLGKSQILAMLHQEFRSNFRVVNVQACSRMSRRHDLLQNILFELGQPYRQLSEGELRLALIDFLRPTPQCPHGILLLVDDGHTLPGRLLDELRLIHNFVRDGQPRVRLVMAGTQILEERLTHPQLEPLHQRIAARCYLAPLRRDEIPAYLQFQLNRAGGPGADLFAPSAIQAVVQLCEGNPRLINQVCDHALMLADSCGAKNVAGDLIAEAFGDIQQIPVTPWTIRPSGRRSVSESSASEAAPLVANQIANGPIQESATSATEGEWSFIEFGELDQIDSKSNPDVGTTPLHAVATARSSAPQQNSSELRAEVVQPSTTPQVPPLSANPFAESFELERQIPNEAKQIVAKMAAAAAATPESLRQRIDRPLESSLRGAHLAAATDDRDMIVVSDFAQAPSLEPGPADELEFDSGDVSRGRAVRVEYNALFQRLRSGKP